MIIVHDPNYRNIILNAFQNTGYPPPMIVEFYNNNALIYTTSVIKGVYNQDLNTVQLYAINSDPTADCTKVLWKDANGNLVYEVQFSPNLTKDAMQVCHIVISYDPNDPVNMQYLEIPSDVLNQLLEEEGPKIINYYLNNIIAVPQNRLHARLVYDNSNNRLYGIVGVNINNANARIRIINGVYTLEF